MTRARTWRTEGIVLRARDIGEADRLLTVLTPGAGKIRVVAPGVRRIRSRKAGHLEPLSRVDLLLAEGRSMDVVSQGQVTEPHVVLREDLWRVTCAMYLAELVERFTEEGAGAREARHVFALLDACLHWLELARSGDLVLRYFELRLLAIHGVLPELGVCIRCGVPPRPESLWVSAADGGLVCGACGGQPGDRTVSVTTVKILRYLAEAGVRDAERLAVPPGSHAEMEAILTEAVRRALDRDLNSRGFLDLVRREEGRAEASAD